MSTPITITGRLVDAPELKFTPSSHAVANFTVAHNRRRFDKQRNEWVDEGADFYRCQAWRDLAQNLAEAWQKGTLVVVTGTIEQRSYETREGEKRSVWEVKVEDAGTSLRFAKRDTPSSSGGYQRSAPNPAGDWGAESGTQEPPW